MTVAIAGLCLAIATVACGDNAGDEATTMPATASSIAAGSSTSTTRPDPLAVEDVDATTRAQVLADLGAAMEALYAMPVEITLDMVEEGEPRTATIRVDRSQGLLEATWIAPLTSGSAITQRNALVDGRAFLKSTTSAEAEAALDYTELPYERNGPELMDAVYAGYGRVNKTLDRNLLLMESLPFAAQITESDAGTEISVIMSPISIYNFYGETGLEAVGGTVPAELTRLAFVIEDGVLRRFVAQGTLFHDGEALELTADIVYAGIEPFTLEIPPIQE